MGGQGAKAGSIAYSEEHAPTLRSAPSGTNTAPDVVYALKGNAIDRNTAQNGRPWSDGASYNWTQRTAAQQHPPLAVETHDMRGFGDYGDGATGSTLKARDYKGATDLVIEQQERRYIVRRLTPLECCRLQGFPDWWEDGVEGSDSARYKMWGNGIALPCAVDVLRRIAKTIKEEST